MELKLLQYCLIYVLQVGFLQNLRLEVVLLLSNCLLTLLPRELRSLRVQNAFNKTNLCDLVEGTHLA